MRDITLKETALSKSLNKLKDGVIVAASLAFVVIIALGAVDASVNDRTDMRNTKIEFTKWEIQVWRSQPRAGFFVPATYLALPYLHLRINWYDLINNIFI